MIDLDNIDDIPDFSALDLNHDGFLTVDDSPYQHGTIESKLWLKNVLEPHMKSQITEEMRTEYGEKVKGAYCGKALVPGEMGSFEHPQGDMSYMVDKIRLFENVDYLTAAKIAEKIIEQKYGIIENLK
jgi:hypothetical protein